MNDLIGTTWPSSFYPHGLVRDRCDVEDSPPEQAVHDRRQPGQPEPLVVGAKHDLGVGLCRALRDDRWFDDIEVIPKALLILELSRVIDRLQRAPLRPDERQLHTETVLPAHDPLLVLLVVRRGPEVCKDHLGYPQAVLRVLLNVDAVTVVQDADRAVVTQRHVDVRDLVNPRRSVRASRRDPHPRRVVSRVYQHLVEYLVQAVDDLVGLDQTDPVSCVVRHVCYLLRLLDGTDVGVGCIQDMFLLVLLLVFGCQVSACHSLLWRHPV